jgi:hypothetical protein
MNAMHHALEASPWYKRKGGEDHVVVSLWYIYNKKKLSTRLKLYTDEHLVAIDNWS